MNITDGEKSMTLEELARKICKSLVDDDAECCYNGKCPAAEHCRHGHNGMIDWLREKVGK